MLPILAISVYLLAPVVMLAIHRLWPTFSANWLVGVAAALLGWMIVLFMRPIAAYLVALPFFASGLPLNISPALLIDRVSWPFAVAVASLALAVILTAVARPMLSWHAWAGTLFLAGFSLFSILAGNPFTLLAAWAALDLVELVILLGQVPQSALRERIVVALSPRIAGILVVIWAIISEPTAQTQLGFEGLSPQIGVYLLLASGLRLGILPLNLPFPDEMVKRRGLETMLRLASPAAALVLLVRIAQIGVIPAIALVLSGLTLLAALYGSWYWAAAPDELAGRAGWMLGAAGMAMASAIEGRPEASLAWGLTALLPGGVLFLASARPRSLYPLLGLTLLGLSALPFTPAWQGAQLYTGPLAPLTYLFLPAHALLLAGSIRHSLRSGDPLSGPGRYIRVLYLLGLGLLSAIYWFLAWLDLPLIPELPLAAWLAGPISLGAAYSLWLARMRFARTSVKVETVWVRLFSLDWLYRLAWALYHFIGRVMAVITLILEGEGGLLWTFVLLVLLFSLLQQAGSQGLSASLSAGLSASLSASLSAGLGAR